MYIYRYTRNALVTGRGGGSPAEQLSWGEKREFTYCGLQNHASAHICRVWNAWATELRCARSEFNPYASRVSYPPSYLDITAEGSTDPLRFLQPGIQFTWRFVTALYVYDSVQRTWQFHQKDRGRKKSTRYQIS